MDETKPTTDRTNTARQSRRRQRLDQATKRYGFDTWAKFETWVISNEIDWFAAVDELQVPIIKENPMKSVDKVRQDIVKARGGCIAVRVYDVNGSGNIEAEIDPAAAKYCPCKFCKAGDLTTSA